jgi:Fe-S cluster biogenesis protein NfuA
LRIQKWFQNQPELKTVEEMNMKEEVQNALNEIRPSLQADGGDVELVDVEDGIVKVRLTGACGGCPMSQMTLKQGIEAYVKKKIPEIVSVESV